MYYTKKTFTLPATEGTQQQSVETCTQHGHMWADRRGKCVRCGKLIRDMGFGKPEETE
jgi:hypothetical protein